MNKLFPIFLVLAVLGNALAVPEYLYPHIHDITGEEAAHYNFYNFAIHYDKQYHSTEEFIFRYTVFYNNFLKIVKHNANPNRNFTMGVNHFADFTQSEFSNYIHGFNTHASNVNKGPFYVNHSANLPTHVDWRDNGIVNPIKDQGECGACYAFSALATLESVLAQKTGKLLDLSEQQVVDCDKKNMGCEGGIMDNVWDWIKNNGGIEEYDNYHYHGVRGKCLFNKKDAVAQVTGRINIAPNDEESLLSAVARHPVSIAIHADTETFQFYSSGVFYDELCDDSAETLDHAMTIVGYGVEDGKQYWLVRNSWSEDWGEAGYVKIARGGVNTCGILQNPSYPLV